MIEFIRGEIATVRTDHAVVDVGGVGIRVEVAPALAGGLREGKTQQISTSMVVREDSWTLFGFADADEREVFQSVQSVSGIGPRTAQALIGTLSADGVRAAVASGDEKALTRAPGIGKKGAQRMILELGDRLGPASGEPSAASAGPTDAAVQPWRLDVRAALVSLGFSASESEQAMDRAAARLEQGRDSDTAGQDAGATASVDVAVMIRAALSELNHS